MFFVALNFTPQMEGLIELSTKLDNNRHLSLGLYLVQSGLGFSPSPRLCSPTPEPSSLIRICKVVFPNGITAFVDPETGFGSKYAISGGQAQQIGTIYIPDIRGLSNEQIANKLPGGTVVSSGQSKDLKPVTGTLENSPHDTKKNNDGKGGNGKGGNGKDGNGKGGSSSLTGNTPSSTTAPKPSNTSKRTICIGLGLFILSATLLFVALNFTPLLINTSDFTTVLQCDAPRP